MENGPFEDVFPIENGDIPASYVSLPEGRIFNFDRVLPLQTWMYWFSELDDSDSDFAVGCWFCISKNRCTTFFFPTKDDIVKHPLETPNRWCFHIFFSPLFGETIHFDEHIFSNGWFNHQLANRSTSLKNTIKSGIHVWYTKQTG